MSADQDHDELLRELPQLRHIEAEYRVTLQVLAVVAERLISVTKAAAIEVSAHAIAHSPDLFAWKDPQSGAVMIRLER